MNHENDVCASLKAKHSDPLLGYIQIRYHTVFSPSIYQISSGRISEYRPTRCPSCLGHVQTLCAALQHRHICTTVRMDTQRYHGVESGRVHVPNLIHHRMYTIMRSMSTLVEGPTKRSRQRGLLDRLIGSYPLYFLDLTVFTDHESQLPSLECLSHSVFL